MHTRSNSSVAFSSLVFSAWFSAGFLQSSANAQTTAVVRAQVWDGSAWVERVQRQPSLEPGPVYVRYVASYVGVGGPTPFAIAGLNMQPSVRRAASDDRVDVGYGPIVDPINPAEPSGESRFYGYRQDEHGRPDYLSFANILPSNAITAHRDTLGTEGVIRLAQAGVTNAPGSGAGTNNLNGSGGIPMAQNVTGPGRPPDSPSLREGFINIPIYGMRLTLGGSDADRNASDASMDVMISASAFSTGGTLRWFANATEISGSITSPASQIEFIPAYVDIVPAPGGVALIAGMVSIAGRRRRA